MFNEFIQPLNTEPVDRHLISDKEIYLIIEKKIYYNCKEKKIPGLDFEDLCQEVRMRIYKELDNIRKNLDHQKNVEGYIATRVKWRITDVWRKYNKSDDVYTKCVIVPLDD